MEDQQTKMAIGDVVKLRSGGPQMTIEVVTESTGDKRRPVNMYACVWFDANGHILRENFIGAVIESAAKISGRQRERTVTFKDGVQQ